MPIQILGGPSLTSTTFYGLHAREGNAEKGAASSRSTFVYDDSFINGLDGKVFWYRGTVLDFN
jgi:hypothetical protein